MKTLLYSTILLTLCSQVAFGLEESDIMKAYYASYENEKGERYDEAIQALMKLYKEHPKFYTLNLRLGWLHYLKQSYDTAKRYYEKAIKSVPLSVDARLGLTLPLMAQEEWEDVEQILYQILNKDYYNYYANLRLSYVLRMQAKYDIAEKVINKMLPLWPTDVGFLSELALLKTAIGDFDTAAETYHDVLVLDPGNELATSFFEEE